MKKSIWIFSTAILFTLMFLTPTWTVAQTRGGSSMTMPCPKMGQGMGGGMMDGKGMMKGKGMGMMHGKGMMGGKGMGMMHGKKGRCPNCPMGKGMGMRGGKGMMHGKGMMKGKGMSKMGGGDMMRDFHRWMKQFMAHRSLFDLTSEQMTRLDDIIMGHMKNAIQNKADIRVAKVELRQMIRRTPMDLSAVENQLNEVASLKAGFQMEGIRLYSDLLNMLTDQQKEKVDEIIGSPFPAPWEKMFPESGDAESEGGTMEMENPHEGHHMEGSGSGMDMDMDMETEPEEEMNTGDDSESAT